MAKGVYVRTKSLERTYPTELVERVRSLYHEQGMSQEEIADVIVKSQKVVFNVMRKSGIPRRSTARRNQKGANNSLWKGKLAGYSAFHLRVISERGQPSHCEQCGRDDPEKTYDWANLTGCYDDPNDYRRLCRSCHWILDRTVKNLRKVLPSTA